MATEPDREARIAALRARIAEARGDLDALQDEAAGEPAAERLRAAFTGREQAFQALLARLERVAGTELPALIEGPPGVGKSLLALAIHQTSGRRSHPLRSMTAQDELHQRWEAAAGGTLLVHHVDRLRPDVQEALLGRLQADRPNKPRLLATAHDAEASGQMLPPLLDRLRVLRLRLAPLSDVPRAAALLFQRHLRAGGRAVSEEALDVLAAATWPENLRQVDQAAQRALALAGSDPIERPDVEKILSALRRVATDDDEPTLEQLERATIEQRLERFDWAQQPTADSLGIDRKTLYRKIRRYGLDR